MKWDVFTVIITWDDVNNVLLPQNSQPERFDSQWSMKDTFEFFSAFSGNPLDRKRNQVLW